MIQSQSEQRIQEEPVCSCLAGLTEIFYKFLIMAYNEYISFCSDGGEREQLCIPILKALWKRFAKIIL